MLPSSSGSQLPAPLSGPPVRQAGSTESLVSYLKVWGSRHRLLLVPGDAVARSQRGRLFPIYKNSTSNRVVFARCPRNDLEYHYAGYSRFSASGPDFCEVFLEAGVHARLFCEDLSN